MNRARQCRIGCAAMLVALAAAQVGCAAGVTVVRDGRAVAKVYTTWSAVAPTQKQLRDRKWRAANPGAIERSDLLTDLVYHVEKMSGAALEIINTDDPGQVKAPAIVLGDVAAGPGVAPPETPEGFRILVRDGLVRVLGCSDAAVSHGVYELLGRLGCDWVMPGRIGEIIPERKTVVVPEMDVSQAPDFRCRSLWYRGYNQPRLPEERARFEQWKRRQKAGGDVGFLRGVGGHIWGSFIKRHKAEFEKDPTMLALRRARDGSMERAGPQLESTHPRVIELFAQDIKAVYERNIGAGTWTKDTAAGFGIGPADGLGYSMSPESLLAGSGRTDPIVGEIDRTDHLILLGNQILEQVHKEYPNAYVGFYSYSVHADYPARYDPDPKIAQIFAPINFSRFHSALDENSKTQSYYRDVLEQWGRLSRLQGNVLFFRGYNWNLAENMLPYSKARIWGEELPWYKRNGIVGLNVEATKAWSVNGPSDYVFMKLAWDTSLGWQGLLTDYCRKSFGAAAGPMERYLLSIIETQHASGQEAGSYHALHLIYDDQWVAAAQTFIDDALGAAATDADRTRVTHFGYGLEALRLYLQYHKATMRFDFQEAQAAYDAMHAHWQKVYDINTDLVANEAPAYLKRFIAQFVGQALKHSTDPYRMVAKLPDELITMFDPNEVGHRMNYQGPMINDSGFVRTRTISTTWDAQGLAGIRSGAVWYRFHFRLPADADGQPIGLFIGGVEDTANVWINGQSIGTSGRRFSFPSVFDLTEGISYDGENVLAIQVVRQGKANEIGLGGILRPSFVFAGPRLPRKAPKELELRRILPGGELGELEQ